MTDNTNRDADDDAQRPKGLHECFKCTRGDDTRIYFLQPVASGAELWRAEFRPGEEPIYQEESALSGAEEAALLLEEIRRALTAGGWRFV